MYQDAEYSEEAIEWKKKCLRDDLRSKLQKIGISAELESIYVNCFVRLVILPLGTLQFFQFGLQPLRLQIGSV